MSDPEKHAIDTRLIHSGKEHNRTNAIAPPIFQSTTYAAQSEEQFREMATTPRHPEYYARYGNPTQTQAEAIIADLEGGESALLTSSGIGAITASVMAMVSAGDHVITQRNTYPAVTTLLEQHLVRYGVESTLVDQIDISAFERAIRPNTRLIMVESPSNPLLRLTDLRTIVALAKANNILTLADNTFATPINQNPLALGFDIVAHSATKYLGGHTDLMAGAVISTAERVEQIWRMMTVLGSALNGIDSWLLLRGLRTLSLRVGKQNDSALKIAEFLQNHPNIERVHYPGLPSHPQHSLAQQQMSQYGGMLSFEVAGGYREAMDLITNLELFTHATSLGGIESLVSNPAVMWMEMLSEDELTNAGIYPNLVRMSVGLEDADDLIADLDRALRS